MDDMTRRSALTLGLTVAAAMPVAVAATPAAAAMYGPDAGKEIMPGVREIDLGDWPVKIGSYTKVTVRDYVSAPGAHFPEEKMANDMVCQILEGAYKVKQGENTFVAETGHTFACGIDTLEEDWNEGSVDAVMRVVNLLA
jgi:hypothetical protein